jgi:hypothetical protein
MDTELKDPQHWRFRAEAVYAVMVVVVFARVSLSAWH